jgi:hypothetical protein
MADLTIVEDLWIGRKFIDLFAMFVPQTAREGRLGVSELFKKYFQLFYNKLPCRKIACNLVPRVLPLHVVFACCFKSTEENL